MTDELTDSQDEIIVLNGVNRATGQRITKSLSELEKLIINESKKTDHEKEYEAELLKQKVNAQTP